MGYVRMGDVKMIDVRIDDVRMRGVKIDDVSIGDVKIDDVSVDDVRKGDIEIDMTSGYGTLGWATLGWVVPGYVVGKFPHLVCVFQMAASDRKAMACVRSGRKAPQPASRLWARARMRAPPPSGQPPRDDGAVDAAHLAHLAPPPPCQ